MGESRSLPALCPLVIAAGVIALGCSTDGEQDSTSGQPMTSTAGETSAGSGSGADSSGTAGADEATTADADSTDSGAALIEERPYVLVVPESYDSDVPTPVVVLLHGYGATAALQDFYFRFTPDAEEHGYLLALPNGLSDEGGSHFWNATDACCNFGNDPVDDVAYLGAVIDDVQAQYNVDAKRVFVVGHSNGGFMAHRLACDIGERIAAIVSLAGAVWADTSACAAEATVNVLQVHGTDDDRILYDGGDNGGIAYPSARDTVAQWADSNGCEGELTLEGTADIEVDLEGAETQLESYAGCPAGGQVSLWSIEAGSHLPAFDDTWADTVWSYLEAHPKP